LDDHLVTLKMKEQIAFDSQLRGVLRDPCAKLSVALFYQMMTLVLDTIVVHFDSLEFSESGRNPCSDTVKSVDVALKIVALIARSRFQHLLKPFFFRPLCARICLRARALAEMSLPQISVSAGKAFPDGRRGHQDPVDWLTAGPTVAAAAMNSIIATERLFKSILAFAEQAIPSSSSSSKLLAALTHKVKVTISRCACGLVTREMLQQSQVRVATPEIFPNGQFSGRLSDELGGVRYYLKRYLIERDLADPRFRPLRNLLGIICTHSTPQQLKKLELIWRDVISESLSDLLTNNHAFSQEDGSTAGLTARVDTTDAIQSLMLLLRRSRNISLFELSDTNLCAMSADFAFTAGVCIA
jgi:hypothetical protein